MSCMIKKKANIYRKEDRRRKGSMANCSWILFHGLTTNLSCALSDLRFHKMLPMLKQNLRKS